MEITRRHAYAITTGYGSKGKTRCASLSSQFLDLNKCQEIGFSSYLLRFQITDERCGQSLFIFSKLNTFMVVLVRIYDLNMVGND